MTINFYAVSAVTISVGLCGLLVKHIVTANKRRRPTSPRGLRVALKAPDESPFDRSTPVERVYRHFGMLKRTKSHPGNFGTAQARAGEEKATAS